MFGAKVGVGLAGAGYWGRNLARNLFQMGHLAAVCDPSAKVLKEMKASYKGVRTTARFEDLLHDDKVKAVAIAAPAARHHELVAAVPAYAELMGHWDAAPAADRDPAEVPAP